MARETISMDHLGKLHSEKKKGLVPFHVGVQVLVVERVKHIVMFCMYYARGTHEEMARNFRRNAEMQGA